MLVGMTGMTLQRGADFVADFVPSQRFAFEVRRDAAAVARVLRVPVLDVVVPVYNEEAQLAVFLMALGITSGALDALHSLVADPSRTVELTVLVVANVAATVLRFVLLRGWVFHAGRAGSGPMHEPFARRASRKAVSRT
jgi:putative flippase GtrA